MMLDVCTVRIEPAHFWFILLKTLFVCPKESIRRRYRVPSTTSPRMTSEKAFQSKDRAAPQPVNLQRVDRIRRATGNKTAPAQRAKQRLFNRRDYPAIEPNEKYQNAAQHDHSTAFNKPDSAIAARKSRSTAA